ncbi:MAG: LysR family transcriptional regulator, partial [Roseibium sp.]|uniref:helix-turn-helix domain-containing protein n=1 Tax=Roseibium sp. TaxID=1936156 RepID=UPI0026308D1F
MLPNSNDLLIFLSVAEARSITVAAQQCGLTKSAVSQALKRIEDAVGAKVLFRTTRSMSLT